MFIHTVYDVYAWVVCLLLFTVISDQKKEQENVCLLCGSIMCMIVDKNTTAFQHKV